MSAARRVLLLLTLASCATARAVTQEREAPVVVLISANAEWKALTEVLHEAPTADTPYGPWVQHRGAVYFHGGYGKVSAAGSTQYAIARWRPRLLMNLGTCGGFGGRAKEGDVVLVEKTIIYDLYEAMGDAAETIADYSTPLDVSRWPARLRGAVRVGPMVSGDRDLVPGEVAGLAQKYGAFAGDWESGAIAYVAAHNHVPVFILRYVTDVVSEGSNPTAGNLELWQQATRTAMAKLVGLADEALPELSR